MLAAKIFLIILGLFFIFKFIQTFYIKRCWSETYTDILSVQKKYSNERHPRKYYQIQHVYEANFEVYKRTLNLISSPLNKAPIQGTKEILYYNPYSPHIYKLDYSINHVVQITYLGSIALIAYIFFIVHMYEAYSVYIF